MSRVEFCRCKCVVINKKPLAAL